MKLKNYTGSDLGNDFKTLYRSEKKRITNILKELGCTDIVMSRQFYYFYGFFTAPSGQCYYFSVSDVRYFNYNSIMYRTAKSYNDYTGGLNFYIGKNDLENIKLK